MTASSRRGFLKMASATSHAASTLVNKNSGMGRYSVDFTAGAGLEHVPRSTACGLAMPLRGSLWFKLIQMRLC